MKREHIKAQIAGGECHMDETLTAELDVWEKFAGITERTAVASLPSQSAALAFDGCKRDM